MIYIFYVTETVPQSIRMDSTVQWFNNATHLMTRLNLFICVMFWVRSLDGCMGRNANNNGSLLRRVCAYEIDLIQLIRPPNQMHKGLPHTCDQQSYMPIRDCFSDCVRCCLVCSYTRLEKRKFYAHGVFSYFLPRTKMLWWGPLTWHRYTMIIDI